MSARIDVTADDARLLRVLSNLVIVLPEKKRASHLAEKCAALAVRMERALKGGR